MLEYLMVMLGAMRENEEGQTAVEYALVLLLIALVLIAALATGLGDALANAITKLKNSIG